MQANKRIKLQHRSEIPYDILTEIVQFAPELAFVNKSMYNYAYIYAFVQHKKMAIKYYTDNTRSLQGVPIRQYILDSIWTLAYKATNDEVAIIMFNKIGKGPYVWMYDRLHEGHGRCACPACKDFVGVTVAFPPCDIDEAIIKFIKYASVVQKKRLRPLINIIKGKFEPYSLRLLDK